MNKTTVEISSNRSGSISRRDLLKYFGSAGLMAALPFPLMNKAFATVPGKLGQGVDLQQSSGKYPDWMVEARIFGLSINGLEFDSAALAMDLDSVIKQGANVVEADSRLSDYISDQEFELELLRIKKSTQLIHERGLKVVWYIPALEVITPNGRLKDNTIGKQNIEWLQLSFDRKRRAVFYGKKVFWVEPDDESAWMCPNSPYKDWLLGRLAKLAKTGIDGLWLDVPLFGLVVGKWGCACAYCRDKFSLQTGMEFPSKFDMTDARFWRYIQWRHQTLTEFMVACRKVISAANPNTVTIAEVVSLDHLGATQWGTEGSQMSSHYVVWEQDGVSETTGMADASYDDWISQFNTYKYCRGATMDRPSWAFSYGFNHSDAQLVMAGVVAAQNNPYELKTPKMTTTVGAEFRGMMYNWIADHSTHIFKSKSLAPVAVIYSARNRDFLDALHEGGMIIQGNSKYRDRRWLGVKAGSPLYHEYMGDYRGLSLMLYQNQVPTDIYPISRVNHKLLAAYPVLVLPNMAILSEDEKELLLQAVRKGTTLIVSGPEPGLWNLDGSLRETSQWGDLIDGAEDKPFSRKLGKGRICFWREEVGRNYLRTHAQEVSAPILGWLKGAGVEPWTTEQHRVVVQPYVYENKMIVHVLNYEWTGGVKNEPRPLQIKLSIPWQTSQSPVSIVQSEPQWKKPKTLRYDVLAGKLEIPLTVGINSLLTINT